MRVGRGEAASERRVLGRVAADLVVGRSDEDAPRRIDAELGAGRAPERVVVLLDGPSLTLQAFEKSTRSDGRSGHLETRQALAERIQRVACRIRIDGSPVGPIAGVELDHGARETGAAPLPLP